MNVKQLDQAYIAPTYGRFDLAIASGSGAILKDEAGKEYIDLGSGIAVNTFGACDPIWQKAVVDQVMQLQHTSNLYYTAPQTKLAQILCEKTGFQKVFFGNSGAEANECAIKVARKYSSDKYGGDRNIILTLNNSFHGRTLATLAATGQDAFHHHFGPFPAGFAFTPANDIPALEQALKNESVCSFMVEMVQGEGGVNVLTKEFVKQAAQLCQEKDIIFMVDEVQTGNGRTGKLFSYMHYDVMPDVITTAKGLGGGLPIGACLLGEKVKGVLSPGDHGSTFGGNPVCAAGAISIMNRLDDPLMSQVMLKSQFIMNELRHAPGVIGITGMGLMLGIETERPAKEVVAACMAQGVLPLTAKNKVRLLPPLNIEMDTLKKAIAILKACMV